jgi:hypothetical protein
MPLQILFWVLFVIWFVLGIWPPGGRYANFVLAALIFVLGWRVFGFIVQ